MDLLNTSNRNKVSYDIYSNTLTIDEVPINLNEITSVWLRKIGQPNDVDFFLKANKLKINPELVKHLLGEYNVFLTSILSNISSKAYWITDFKVRYMHKWDILRKAILVGLKVPATQIVNNKFDLSKYVNDKEFITKPLRDPVFFAYKHTTYSMYTKLIDNSVLTSYPEWFFPSVVQEKIEKEFEIRCFFLEDQFFSMAIISQNDSKTVMDYREYNLIKFNRNIPIKLPLEIESKLKLLSKKLGINCGSFDLIKDKNGEYIFLEINPNGQYGMVDMPCNYNLNKLIAETLIKESNVRRRKKSILSEH